MTFYFCLICFRGGVWECFGGCSGVFVGVFGGGVGGCFAGICVVFCRDFGDQNGFKKLFLKRI